MSERAVPPDGTLDALLTDPGRADQILCERLLAKAEANDPVLRDLIMAAALPRSFDMATLAAGVGRPPDEPELIAAFGRLVGYPFVDERAEGRFAVHDSVRKELLAQWRRPEPTGGGMDEHLRRLLRHHTDRLAQARKGAHALARVAPLMRRVNPGRYGDAAERIEDVLIRSAIEALHAAMMIGPHDGWQQLATTFQTLEAERRYRLCELLVNAFDEGADLLPADVRAWHEGWVVYYTGRLANDRLRWRVAEAELSRVARPEEVDLKLATWIHSQRATSLRGQCRFTDALAALDREIGLHDEHHVDDWNASVPWGAKALIHATLWDGDGEVAAHRQGLARANAVANGEAAASHLLELVSAESAIGHLDAAAGHLLDAVRRIRIELTGNQATSRWLAAKIMTTFGARSARLLAAVTCQYKQLNETEWPNGLLDVQVCHAAALVAGGAGDAALEVYEEAQRLAAEHVPDRRWEVDADRAGAATELNARSSSGGELNLALLDDPIAAADPWTRARCLSNAAMSFLAEGKLARGLDCIRSGRALWESMRHRRATGLTYAIEAELLRQSGDLDAAEQALAHVGDEPARGYEADRYEYVAHVAHSRREYARAADTAQRCLASSTQASSRSDVARRAVLAVDCLLAAGRYDEAVAASADAHRLLDELRAFATWQSTEQTRLADQHAARAVRIFVAGHGPLTARVRSAREHLVVAVDLDPEFGWFRLELGLLDLYENRHKDAAQRFDEAAERTDDPVLRTAIEAMRAEVAGAAP